MSVYNGRCKPEETIEEDTNMAKPRPRLQVVEAQPDAPAPPRELLKQAINDRDRLAEVAGQARDAVSRARELIAQAGVRVEQAEQAVEVARTKHATEVTAALASGSSKLPSSALRAARASQLDAADQLAAGEAALGQLQINLSVADQELRSANSLVLERAKRVIGSEVQGWPAQMKTLIEEFQSRVAVFSYLIRSEILDDSDPNQVPRHHDPMFRHSSPSVEMLRALGVAGWIPQWLNDLDRHESVEAFRGVLDRLQQDADTPLPK
jgi:hypothetical protein